MVDLLNVKMEKIGKGGKIRKVKIKKVKGKNKKVKGKNGADN